MVNLGRMRKTEREEDAWFGVYLWETRKIKEKLMSYEVHKAYSVAIEAGIIGPHPYRCQMLPYSNLRQPIAPARSQHQLPQ